jgi:hypothetical protein
MTLVDTRTFDTGVVIHSYRPAGPDTAGAQTP